MLLFILTLLCSNVESFDMSSATLVYDAFINFFVDCMITEIQLENFMIDDLRNYINYPSKTTVGLAPKFTSNRKFFANMITTSAFKEMLNKDEDDMRRSLIKKIKFCDEAVMQESTLKEFYNKQID